MGERPSGRVSGCQAVLIGLMIAVSVRPVIAADRPPSGSKREVAGTSLSARGTLLRREHLGADWQAVDDKQPLYGGDLLVGLPGAALQSPSGAVRLTMQPDFASPLPVLEPGVILHAPADFDLDFTLDRGRLELTNTKEKGPARVHIRAWGSTWEATLAAPDTRLSVAVLARWRPGSRFTTTPGPQDVPSADVVFLVLSGEVSLQHDGSHYLLTAPPGPALMAWNNFVGQQPSPRYLDKLPGWASPPLKEYQDALAHLCRSLAAGPVGPVLAEMSQSDNPAYRRVAIVLMGATDDLRGLGKVLQQEKHRDAWEDAMLVLRYWLGRAPGQDQAFYRNVQEVWGYTPAQAQTLLDFLHGFSESDLKRPETYQMLIGYLGHPRLAIRALAHWYLVRLVPAGRKIAYDPLAAPAKRNRARQEWKKLVPPGTLPPREKDKP